MKKRRMTRRVRAWAGVYGCKSERRSGGWAQALARALGGGLLALPLLAAATERTADGAFRVGGPLGNGVMQVEVNGKAINGVTSPMITEMRIGNTVVVPRENAGAGFQFATRSEGGNKYNPTLGGDCKGRAPDIGPNYIQQWGPLDFLPPHHGVLLGVQPYLYQGDQTALAGDDPGCTGPVEQQAQAAPYFFHWGVLLGDGGRVPREAMLLAMATQKLHPQAPDINKYLTEAPAMFVDRAFSYAYTASGAPDVMQWVPLRLSPLGSNHVMSWPLGAQREVGSASTVMLCTAPIERQPLCVAIHSGFQVKASVSRRAGSAGLPDLVYMGLTGAAACGGVTDLSCNLVKDPFTWILDDQVHVITRIVAVGSPATVRAALVQTRAAVPITSRRDW